MTDTTKQKELEELVAKAEAALKEAEQFAEENKLSFSYGPTYGMGGYFEGDKEQREYKESGWYPSSQSC